MIMKNPGLLFITAIIIIGVGCKKEKGTASSILNSTTESYDPADIAISGKWFTDSIVSYSMGTIDFDSSYTDTTCYVNLELSSSSIAPSGQEGFKNCFWAPYGGIAVSTCWKLTSGTFDLCGVTYNINNQTESTLELQAGSVTGPGCVIYFFHR